MKQADPDAAQEELFAKLKERQLKLKAQVEVESMTSGHDSIPRHSMNPNPSSEPHPSTEPHPKVSLTQPSGDLVQMQLQYLQQQVLQQQMMQLQQQFQQMQHMALQQNVGVMMPPSNHRYGKSLIPISDADEQAMKMEAPRCLSLLGFTRAESIRQHQIVGSSVQIIVPDPADEVHVRLKDRV